MKISDLSRESVNKIYQEVLGDKDAKTMRELCKTDLFFLLSVICRRRDMDRDWIYERCREFESDRDGNLDLWFRGGYKSSIITNGGTMQDILIDPEITVGIFSHTRPISKAFGSQIKREFESNQLLKDLFPDVLYDNPFKEAPKWSIDDGFIVKRKGNPKESTVECWGLIDGQPTSKHYKLMVYDDVVTRESVGTPEMIEKTTEAFRLSLNLSGENCRKRFIGTRYHSQDTYQVILDGGTAKPRIHPATKDGTREGKSVLLTKEELDSKYRDMGVYVFNCQMLQNPIADKAMGFKEEWIQSYNGLVVGNKYILVDPASAKKKDSDYTVVLVIGLGVDGNYYLIDGVRDRLNLAERTRAVMNMHRKWKPLGVGYEKYGMQSDIEHIEYVQEHEGYRFGITELAGSMPKVDRIRRLVPLFEAGRVWMPSRLLFTNYEGIVVDLIDEFIRFEYRTFPVSAHEDMLDCFSRIVDAELSAVFPKQTAVGSPVERKIVNRVQKYSPLGARKDRQQVDETEIATVMGRSKNWRETIKR